MGCLDWVCRASGMTQRLETWWGEGTRVPVWEPRASASLRFPLSFGSQHIIFCPHMFTGWKQKASPQRVFQGPWMIRKELFDLGLCGSALVRGAAAPTLRLPPNAPRRPLSVSVGPHVQIRIPSTVSPLHQVCGCWGRQQTSPFSCRPRSVRLTLRHLTPQRSRWAGAQCGEPGRLLDERLEASEGFLALVTIVTSLWSLHPVVFARYSFITRPPLRFPPTGEQAPSTFTVKQLTHGAFEPGRGGWQGGGEPGGREACPAVWREGSGLGRGWDPFWSCPLRLQRREDSPTASYHQGWAGPCSHPKFSNFLACCAKHWGRTSWDCH